MLGDTTAIQFGFPGFLPSGTSESDLVRDYFSALPNFFYPTNAHIVYSPAPLYSLSAFPYQAQLALSHFYQEQALPADPETSLVAAYQKNDIATLKMLLQHHRFHLNHIPIERKNTNGEQLESDSLLLNACRQGKMEIMDLLIGAGANINIGNCAGESLLFLSYQGITDDNVRYQRIESLLKRGACPNVNAPSDGWQPLLVLAWHEKRQDIVELLLRYKADPNVYDQVLTTKGTRQPLLMAAHRAGDQEIVSLLLQSGANPDECEYDNFDHPGLSYNDVLRQHK